MADKAKAPPEGQPPMSVQSMPPETPQPTIHEAVLESGPSGRVLRGVEIDIDTALARRRGGENVVVCGDDTAANRRLAGQIETSIGPCVRADPHTRHAGPYALPHFQQARRTPPGPGGHAFYETDRRKARGTT